MSIEFLKTDYEKVDYICNLLISRARGEESSNEEYKILRNDLLLNGKIEEYFPTWLRTNRSLDSFWGFIKPKYSSYAERTTFLNTEFAPILNFLEFGEPIQKKVPPTIIKQLDKDIAVKRTTTTILKKKTKVFIVHGHDNETKQEVARFIDSLGLEPIILHEKASSGMTIIEKIEYYAEESDFAIVLYTPCDKGRGVKETTIPARNRARQNVIFEHGYLMAKLGLKNVCALVKGDIETPNDISGVVYVSIDLAGAWKIDITKELKACGYKINSII